MAKWRRIIGLTVLCLGVLGPAAIAEAQPQYVALGDSYSSGVGTRVFYSESGGARLLAELPGVQRCHDDRSQQQTAGHVEQLDGTRHHNDRWQRRRLQR